MTIVVYCPRRLMREALVFWLNRTRLPVVDQTADLAALPQMCARHSPDLLIVDAGSDVLRTIDLLGVLHVRFPQTRIAIIYDVLPATVMAQAQRSGLDTLLPSSIGLESLLLCLQRLRSMSGAGPGGRSVDPDLVDHEREVLTLLSGGHTVRDIATSLNITPKTVESIKRRIYAKLRVASQSHAVARAVGLGLVDTEPTEPPFAIGGRPDLTAREFDILRSIAMGHTVRQTADLLAIAEKTVENLQARLFLKLGTHNRAGAIRAAYALGLLDRIAEGVQRTGP